MLGKGSEPTVWTLGICAPALFSGCPVTLAQEEISLGLSVTMEGGSLRPCQLCQLRPQLAGRHFQLKIGLHPLFMPTLSHPLLSPGM